MRDKSAPTGVRIHLLKFIIGLTPSVPPSRQKFEFSVICAQSPIESNIGRGLLTNGQTAPYPSLTADPALRLQQRVTGWRGAERGQPLSVLHNECLNAVGPGGRHLLSAILLLVKDLDETHLQAAIRTSNGKGRGSKVRFRVKMPGRFDLALVSTGAAGEVPDRWLLAVEENLSLLINTPR